jgi:hypothetical protein
MLHESFMWRVARRGFQNLSLGTAPEVRGTFSEVPPPRERPRLTFSDLKLGPAWDYGEWQ